MKLKAIKREKNDDDSEASKRKKLDSGLWIKYETILVRDYKYASKISSKLISFDLDGTLIQTKSGAIFAKSKDDWLLWNPIVPSVLKSYYDKGYSMVIFTNQGGIGKGNVKEADFKAKVDAIQEQLAIPMLVIAATKEDEFRKPLKGMWEYFVKNFSKDTSIDLSQSYYVGDAAGRPATETRKKDFTDTDLKYALNVGLQFKTPEEFFLNENESQEEVKGKGKKAVKDNLSFDPNSLPTSGEILKGYLPGEKVTKDTQEVVLFVGPPASGKSTFWQNYMSSYVRVNRDTLKTKEKCVALLDKSLEEGKSCVVDNTNPEKTDRQLFIDVAKKHNVPIRCFIFNVSKDMALHMDKQRKINSARKHLSKHVGRIPIYTFFKKFIQPNKSEGFTAVEEVNFVTKFANDKDKDSFNTLT